MDPISTINAKYQTAQYREIHALLISWENDDLGVEDELHALERVLSNKYFATTRVISIPHEESNLFLERGIHEFKLYYSAPDILLIVYYAGHGAVDDNLHLKMNSYGYVKSHPFFQA